MEKGAPDHQAGTRGEQPWLVLDDLDDLPVMVAELDAVEAFLMSMVDAIMNDGGLTPADSQTPQ